MTSIQISVKYYSKYFYKVRTTNKMKIVQYTQNTITINTKLHKVLTSKSNQHSKYYKLKSQSYYSYSKIILFNKEDKK